MIKIRISYTDASEMAKIITTLTGFKVLSVGREQIKDGHKNIYLELE